MDGWKTSFLGYGLLAGAMLVSGIVNFVGKSILHPTRESRSQRLWLKYLSNMTAYEPGSKLLVLGMVVQPLIGNPYNGYINPYYWVDDHPLLYINICK